MGKHRENVPSACKCYEFFKVYLPQISSHKLVIPPAFISNFDGSFPNNARLKDNTGRLWHVDLERDEKQGVVITKGWQGFATHQSLEFGDFLLFDYDGNSTLTVKIFGKNGCTKDFPYATNICDRPVKEEQDMELEHVPKGEIVVRRAEKSDGSHGTSQRECRKVGVRKSEEPDSVREPAYVRPRNPHFVKRITGSARYRISVPVSAVNSYGINLKSQVDLCDHNGKKWPVKVSFSKTGCIDITRGWNRFRRDHKLQKNNKCIFEFVLGKRKECREVRVQIIRGELETETKNRYQVIG